MVNPRSSQFLTLLCTHMCRFVPMCIGTYIEKENYNIMHDTSVLKLYPNFNVYIRFVVVSILFHISCYIRIIPNAAANTFPAS